MLKKSRFVADFLHVDVWSNSRHYILELELYSVFKETTVRHQRERELPWHGV